MFEPHILAVDLYSGGHHPRYLQYLIEYWIDRQVPCKLTVVGSDRLSTEHPEIRIKINEFGSVRLNYLEVPDNALMVGSESSLIRKDLYHGKTISRIIDTEKPNACLLMYFDHCQLSLGTILRRKEKVIFAGIYLRPSMHYPEFGLRPSLSSRLRDLRKHAVLRIASSNRNLKVLFCLDPFFVNRLQQIAPGADAVHLPDPVSPCQSIKPAKNRTNKMLRLLIAGTIDSRKGVHEVLQALLLIPSDIRIKLAIVGPLLKPDKCQIDNSLTSLQSSANIDVTFEDRYLTENEICDWMKDSDAVLLTYINHIGSSNLLIKAASVPVPVIGSSYGLVGQQIVRHKLGIAVDSANPSEIADAIRDLSRGVTSFEPESALKFASQNNSVIFAETLFKSLLPVARRSAN